MASRRRRLQRAGRGFGAFPDVSTTGNWADVSHYTQVIWRATTQVGCPVHSGTRYDWLVCHYSPGGNIDGKPPI